MWALIGGNASGMRDWRHARPGQARRLKCKCSKEPGSKKEARGIDKVDEVKRFSKLARKHEDCCEPQELVCLDISATYSPGDSCF